jgi:hypothetical protein
MIRTGSGWMKQVFLCIAMTLGMALSGCERTGAGVVMALEEEGPDDKHIEKKSSGALSPGSARILRLTGCRGPSGKHPSSETVVRTRPTGPCAWNRWREFFWKIPNILKALLLSWKIRTIRHLGI